MVSQDYLQKMEVRQNYRNFWHTDLLRTIQADTPYCCLSLFCSPCVSYMLRKRALYNDMSRYVCCAGYMPCSGRCGESRCPEFCLATENLFSSPCPYISWAVKAKLLKDLGFYVLFEPNSMHIFDSSNDCGKSRNPRSISILSCLADMVYCTVCACMQGKLVCHSRKVMVFIGEIVRERGRWLGCRAWELTQHKIEMDKRDGKFGPQPMAVPPVQQMSRIDQPYPSTVGYPPPQSQPQPGYGYPPPPQPQGYPAPGYPPTNSGYPPPGYPPVGYPQSGYPK
ncbi:Glycine-rich protein A3 [Bienertia sinuspersici]